MMKYLILSKNYIIVHQTMKIFDPEKLIPDHECLIKVVASHPFDNSLVTKISQINIRLSENYIAEGFYIAHEDIETDVDKGIVILGVGRYTHLKLDYNSILYHEFGHVADRMDANFQYSEDLKNELSDSGKTCVMELWNVYINSRLNAVGLYMTSGSDCCGILNGEEHVFPGTIEGDLMAHMSNLEGAGFSYKLAKELIENIWKYPNEPLTYPMMITKVKTGLANNLPE